MFNPRRRSLSSVRRRPVPDTTGVVDPFPANLARRSTHVGGDHACTPVTSHQSPSSTILTRETNEPYFFPPSSSSSPLSTEITSWMKLFLGFALYFIPASIASWNTLTTFVPSDADTKYKGNPRFWANLNVLVVML